MSKFQKIGKYTIYFDQTYYLAYAGGFREMTKKQESDWNRTNGLPQELQVRERLKLGYENNPNVVPIKGKNLVEFIQDLNFIPLFDQYFEHTHLLKLTDLVVYESIKQKSYEIAMKG